MGLVAVIITDLSSDVSKELKAFCCTKLHGWDNTAAMMALAYADFWDSFLYNDVVRRQEMTSFTKTSWLIV